MEPQAHESVIRILGLLVIAFATLSGADAAAGWPQAVGNARTTPVFFDLDGDGTLEVIVSTGAVFVYNEIRARANQTG